MSKRKRDPTFAASEKLTLIELVATHFDVVECKKTDSTNIKIKNAEWQKIATEFNAVSSIHPRDWGVLKNCWENLKKRAKQTQTLRNQHFLGTGGGPPKKMIEDPAIERVLELIQTRVTGFTNCFDSDGTLVLASGSAVTQHEEGTSELIYLAAENTEPSHHGECSNDTNMRESLVSQTPVNDREVIEVNWSQYTPSMLRGATNPVLARPERPLPINTDGEMAGQQLPVAGQPLAVAGQPLAVAGQQLPVADPQLPVADLQLPLVEAQPPITPVRTSTTRVAPATMSAATTSRRRPTSRREREAQNLTMERLNTLLKCNIHAEEEHAIQMRILKLKEEKEKEIITQEKLKTEQEKIKLEILEIQLKKLKE